MKWISYYHIICRKSGKDCAICSSRPDGDKAASRTRTAMGKEVVAPSSKDAVNRASSSGESSNVTKGNEMNTQGLAAHIQSLGWEDQSSNFHDVVVLALGKAGVELPDSGPAS